jgi:hypothetical protein
MNKVLTEEATDFQGRFKLYYWKYSGSEKAAVKVESPEAGQINYS